MTTRQFKTHKYLPGAIAGAFFAMDASMAFAQLDEIIVTARKREESLQDVPVTVQALTSDVLEAYNTMGFEDLNDLVSGMSIYNGGPTQPSINLRGVQGNAINAASDDSVAVNLDGVQHSNAQLFRFGLFDLESVEVLKGPQALFFGKNSPGGVVALKTKNPTAEFFSEFQGGYETEGERAYGHVVLSGPLSDIWGARLGVRYQDSEGFFDNRWATGDPTATQPVWDTGPNYDEVVILGTLEGSFERGDARLKLYHADREGGQYNQVGIAVCNSLQPISNPFSDCDVSDNYSEESFIIDPSAAPSRFADDEPSFDYELTQLSLDASYEINDTWEVSSITGWVDIDNFFFGNIGARPANIAFGLGAGQVARVETISQEIRFSGDFDNFQLMFGGFIDDRSTKIGANVWISPTFKLIPDMEAEVDGESWSVFAQANIPLGDSVELSIGARYMEEERTYEGRNLEEWRGIPAGPHRVDPDEIDADNLSPEITLSWEPSADLTLYASYKEGFKSGGFDVAPLDVAPSTVPGTAPVDRSFDQEEVSGFEFGAKWMGLDNTLRINAALFFYEYEDLQQSLFATTDEGGVVVRTLNAGEATTNGFEVDLLWQTPLEGLTLSGNVAYNDNEFDDYESVCNQYQIFVDATGCDIDLDNDPTTDAGGLLTGTGIEGQDRSGHPLRRAPEWSGSLGLNYDTPLSGAVRFKANLIASFSDEYMANGENNPWGVQDDFVLFNAGIGIYADNGSWALDLMSRNLTDEDVALTMFDNSRSGSDTVPENLAYARNAPREIMLQFTFRPELFF